MSKKKSIKLNYLYNILYQLFTMIVPLVTTPYISRILGPQGVGRYSYTYSLVNYFTLFAQLGFGYYAQREMAKHQGSKEKQSVLFFEILFVKTITVSSTLAVYAILCFNGVFGNYTFLMLCWILMILAQWFDVGFVFQGNEEFRIVVIRNFLIKILGIIFIFVFVKSTSDVWIYVLSIAGSNLLGAISTWMYLPKYIEKVSIIKICPWKHLKPAFVLFLPTIASLVYTYVDRSLIGILIQGVYTKDIIDSSNGYHSRELIGKSIADVENGYYEQADKIVRVGISVITALGAVMLPRNAQNYAAGNKNELMRNIQLAFRTVFFVGLPILFGLNSVASILVPWFLGDGFEKCIFYIRLFSPMAILLGLENVIGIQYLIPTGKDKSYTFSIVGGVVLNIGLNYFLIQSFWAAGAIIASVISEMFIIIIMQCAVRTEISILDGILASWRYVIGSVVMFIVLLFLRKGVESTVINTLVLIITGVVIYIGCIVLLRDEIVIELGNKGIKRIKELYSKKYN